MNTIILNGSPKGEKGNSQIFASHFVKGMKNACEITCIAKENVRTLAKEVEQYDTIIFVMPLYVHSLPGIVIKLLEQIQPLSEQNKSMGLIIQSGFDEPAQSRYAKRCFGLLCKRLNYRCLGTVIKGGAAGTYMMPDKMNKKLFAAMEELGRVYEQTGEFSEAIRGEFEKEYAFSKRKARFNQFLYKTGATNIFWNRMLKKHSAFEDRFAKPFANS